MYVEGCDRRKGQKKESVGVCLECAEGMPPENSPNISCRMLILVELRKDTKYVYIYMYIYIYIYMYIIFSFVWNSLQMWCII